jgi:hypothetical protein
MITIDVSLPWGVRLWRACATAWVCVARVGRRDGRSAGLGDGSRMVVTDASARLGPPHGVGRARVTATALGVLGLNFFDGLRFGF